MDPSSVAADPLSLPEHSDLKPESRLGERRLNSRRVFLLILLLAPLLTPLVAPHHDDYYVYSLSVVDYVVSGVACLVAGRRDSFAYRNWQLLAGASFLAAMDYLFAVFWRELWIPVTIQSFLRDASICMQLALTLMAFSFPHSARNVQVKRFDAALLFLSLIVVSMAREAHAFPHHMQWRMWLELLTSLLLAGAAQAVATANRDLRLQPFFRGITLYLWIDASMFFLLNIVNYIWLPNPLGLAAYMLIPMPALLLAEIALHRRSRTTASPTPKSDLTYLGNLEASVLTAGSIGLALIISRIYPYTCYALILFIVLCYVFRTHVHWTGMLREQADLQIKTNKLESLATHDELTGIGNRRVLEQEVYAYMVTAIRPALAVMLIDADHFKTINDSFGHDAGDTVLRSIAGILQDAVAATPPACSARIGGDEFAIFLPDVTAEQALAIADAIRSRVANLSEQSVTETNPRVAGALLTASISIGVATLREHALSLAVLLRAADTALYRSKGEGRNLVRAIDLTQLVEENNLGLLDEVDRLGRG